MARMNRRNLVDLSECSCYHVISRCTRQLQLLGSCTASRAERKGLLLKQLERVANFTAVGVAGWAVMDNHLHLLLKVDAEAARGWSDREVARRWLGLHPARDGYFRPVAVSDEQVDSFVSDTDQVVKMRERLMSISYFMKEIKQELTQRINKLEDTVGSLWAGRFKCKRVTDEAQLLTTLAYIELNPFAAGACKTPEAGKHTSLAARLHGVKAEGDNNAQDARSTGNTDTQDAHPRERRGWWMTVGGGQPGMAGRTRAIMPDTDLTFGRYLKLLDAVARLLRKGKKYLIGDVKTISQRLGVSPAGVAHTLQGWFKEGLSWERSRTAGG